MKLNLLALISLSLLTVPSTVRAGEPKARATVDQHLLPVISLALTADGKTLASGDRGGAVIVSDATTGKTLMELKHEDKEVRGLAFAPGGKTLVAAGATPSAFNVLEGEGKTLLFDLTTKKPVTLPGKEGPLEALILTPDGKTIAWARVVAPEKPQDQTGTRVVLWDVKATKELSSQLVKGHPLAFSADGQAVATSGDGVKVWNARKGTEEVALKVGHVTCAAFDPKGKLLATSWGAKFSPLKESDKQRFEVSLWDLSSGKNRSLKGHEGGVTALAFSPDGTILASGGWDKTIRLRDVATGKELAALKGHTDCVFCVTFSGDGKTLASGGADGTARVWDVQKLLGKDAGK